MDIQAEKLQLIEWLAGLNDAKILNEFIALKKKKKWIGGIGLVLKSHSINCNFSA